MPAHNDPFYEMSKELLEAAVQSGGKIPSPEEIEQHMAEKSLPAHITNDSEGQQVFLAALIYLRKAVPKELYENLLCAARPISLWFLFNHLEEAIENEYAKNSSDPDGSPADAQPEQTGVSPTVPSGDGSGQDDVGLHA